MPYSYPNNVPQWASKKPDATQRVAVRVFNQTLKDTGDEDKARIASLAAMKNSEQAEEDKKKLKKSVELILKAKYNKEE